MMHSEVGMMHSKVCMMHSDNVMDDTPGTDLKLATHHWVNGLGSGEWRQYRCSRTVLRSCRLTLFYVQSTL